MFDIEKVLVDICGDSDVLKDEKVDIFPTQIKKDDLRSLKGIMKIKRTLEIFYLMSFF